MLKSIDARLKRLEQAEKPFIMRPDVVAEIQSAIDEIDFDAPYDANGDEELCKLLSLG